MASRFLKNCIAFLLIIGIGACSNEFDLTSEWKDIPVVYGILDVNSNTNYLRVEKAFLDPNRSALEIAQIADSLYYAEDAVKVYVENQDNGARIDFQRVNGEDEGFFRTDGIFVNQPNYIYKGLGQIVKGTDYKVVIERGDNTEPAISEIKTPGDMEVTSPLPIGNGLNIVPGGNLPIQIKTDGRSRRFNISIETIFSVKNGTTGQVETIDTLNWLALTNVIPNAGSSFNAFLVNDGFYEFLGENVTRFPGVDGLDTKRRSLIGANIYVTGGGKELEDFDIVASANVGVSGAETVPFYTNVQNGLGLVTSKHTVAKRDYKFDSNEMYDHLQNNIHTRELNFSL